MEIKNIFNSKIIAGIINGDENSINEFYIAIDKIIDLKIDKLKSKQKKQKCCFIKQTKSFICSYWVLIFIIIILLGAILFCHIYTITDSNNATIVLGFVGILATFVVISNYYQVYQIKQNIDVQIKATEKNFLKIQKDTEYKINLSLGNVSKIYANINFEKHFYINAINSYINAIKSHSQISDKSFVKIDIDSLISLLTSVDWKSYDFSNEMEESNISVFISDIKEIDIEEKQKNEILNLLSQPLVYQIKWIEERKTKQL